MGVALAPPPQQTSLVDMQQDPANPQSKAYLITPVWYRWFVSSLINRVQAAPSVIKGVTLTNQSASITTTAIPIASVTAGMWRISWYARITTVDPVSSSLTVTLSWTESAVALSGSGSAITGNTTTTTQTGSAFIRSDAASPISYSATYASNTPATMKYRLDVLAEFVN